MHSPPVQPSSAITSGTGSVRTMCDEVTVRRERSARQRARGRADRQHGGAGAHAAAVGLGGHAGARPRAGRTRASARRRRAALDQPPAQAEREAGGLQRGEVRHAARRRGRPARRSARAPRPRQLHARARARPAPPRPRRRPGRPRRTPAPSTRTGSPTGRTRRPRPRSRHQAPTRGDRLAGGVQQRPRADRRRSARAGTAPTATCDSQKPPLRPLGPWPQTPPSSSATRGAPLEQLPGGPHARVAPADDHDVGVTAPSSGGARLDRSGLLEPPPGGSVTSYLRIVGADGQDPSHRREALRGARPGRRAAGILHALEGQDAPGRGRLRDHLGGRSPGRPGRAGRLRPEAASKWRFADLPIIPDEFKLVPNDERAAKQLRAIHRLMADDDIDRIVNACDAGREGELIFAYVYDLAEVKKPVERLWLSSMTKKAISRGVRAAAPRRGDEAARGGRPLALGGRLGGRHERHPRGEHPPARGVRRRRLARSRADADAGAGGAPRGGDQGVQAGALLAGGGALRGERRARVLAAATWAASGCRPSRTPPRSSRPRPAGRARSRSSSARRSASARSCSTT